MVGDWEGWEKQRCHLRAWRRKCPVDFFVYWLLDLFPRGRDCAFGGVSSVAAGVWVIMVTLLSVASVASYPWSVPVVLAPFLQLSFFVFVSWCHRSCQINSAACWTERRCPVIVSMRSCLAFVSSGAFIMCI